MPFSTHHKYFESPLGWIEIISSNKFIQLVKFVEIKGNNSSQQPEILENCFIQLQEYFEGKRNIFTVPIQLNGTSFQEQVWKELQNIPIGKTICYLDLSKKINNIGAIRAVGTANGKNKIAIIIPCHRVIGNDGKLTGYSGGLHRKQWLLEHEAKMMGTFSSLF